MSWKMSGAVKDLTHGATGQELSPAEKLTLMVLADYHREDLKCAWPSVERLARESVCSERTLYRVLDSLETVHGLLAIERGGHGPGSANSYAIVIPDRLACTQSGVPVTSDTEYLSPVAEIPVMGDTKTECIPIEPILTEREEPKEEATPSLNSKGQTPEEAERLGLQAEEARQRQEERRAKKQNKGRVQTFPARRPTPIVGTAQSVLQPVKPPETWNRLAVKFVRASDGVAPLCQARDLATFGDLLERITTKWEGEPVVILIEAFDRWAPKQNRLSKWSLRDFIETEAWPIVETLDDAPAAAGSPADTRAQMDEFLRNSKKGA